MKKFYVYILAMIAVFTTSSCVFIEDNDDEAVAITLNGIWGGYMYESYYDRYEDYFNGTEYYTMFRFDRRGYYDGTGTERDEDYYGNIVERDFEWRVDFNTIYIYYSDVYYYNGHPFRDYDYNAVIYNASLNDYYFSGEIVDNSNNRRHFRLEYYSDPWGGYTHTRSADEPTVATAELIELHKKK